MVLAYTGAERSANGFISFDVYLTKYKERRLRSSSKPHWPNKFASDSPDRRFSIIPTLALSINLARNSQRSTVT